MRRVMYLHAALVGILPVIIAQLFNLHHVNSTHWINQWKHSVNNVRTLSEYVVGASFLA